jgi:hypothetical protein
MATAKPPVLQLQHYANRTRNHGNRAALRGFFAEAFKSSMLFSTVPSLAVSESTRPKKKP